MLASPPPTIQLACHCKLWEIRQHAKGKYKILALSRSVKMMCDMIRVAVAVCAAVTQRALPKQGQLPTAIFTTQAMRWRKCVPWSVF